MISFIGLVLLVGAAFMAWIASDDAKTRVDYYSAILSGAAAGGLFWMWALA